MWGWESLFAVVYNTAYRKWNLWSWQEIGFCCWTYAFCWKWVPVIPRGSSVGIPVAVQCETGFGIELSPQFSHRAHIKPTVERVIFWGLCTPLCIIGWRFPAWLLDTVPREKLPDPLLNRTTKNTLECVGSISECKNRACSVTKKKADLSTVTSLFFGDDNMVLTFTSSVIYEVTDVTPFFHF